MIFKKFKSFKLPYTDSKYIFKSEDGYRLLTPFLKPNDLIFYYSPKRLFYLNLYLDLDDICLVKYFNTGDIICRIFYNKS